MIQCLNPTCVENYPTFQNPDDGKFCIKCGKPLLLNNRYLATKILGRGGFGRTFKAVDLDLPRKPVRVIKQFLPDPLSVKTPKALEIAQKLFEQEAISLDNLGKHPQIPELFAYFTIDNCQYLIQEFIPGDNLQQELKKKGMFNQQKIRELLLDLLPVLKFIHDNQLIHRDIKPENIIRRNLTPSPSPTMRGEEFGGNLVLVDFGAAKQATATALAKTGTKIGSAEYVSKEQINGRPCFASDIYSLGVSCLHLLTGISPFNLFDNYEGEWIWRNFLHNNPVDDSLGVILDKMIQEYTKNRYGSVDEVLEALNPQSVKINTGNIPIVQTPVNVPSSNVNTGKMPVPQVPATSSTKPSQNSPLSKGSQEGSTPQPLTLKNYSAEYYTENLGNGITLDMVSIPSGTFMMGSNEHDYEKPIHQVTVPPFYLGKYPVTNAQWYAVMGTKPASKYDQKFQGDNQPVVGVSWQDAIKFCQKLSQKTGKEYQLPSEAEWEYACRSVTSHQLPVTRYCFGNEANLLKEYAWYHENSNGQTHPVGQKKPNNFGLYDMHGNVWEWCLDSWHDNYNGAPTDGRAWFNNNISQRAVSQVNANGISIFRYNLDTLLVNKKNYQLLRGGSWGGDAGDCRSAYRGSVAPDNRGYGGGFRLVCGGAGF